MIRIEELPSVLKEWIVTSPLQAWKNDWESKSGDERILKVRWLLNPEQPPLEDMAVIEQNGQILDIRPLREAETDVLPVILVPPLVNAHTHLEFSSLTEPIRPALPFPDWISAVIQWRRGADSENSGCLQKGLSESLQSGVTVIGEITTVKSPEVDSLAKACTVVSFREIIGLQPEQIPDLLLVATKHLAQFATENTNGAIIGGISPHAPYTVHPDLFESLIDLAVSRGAVVAMHLAETTDEMELLHEGKGRFADLHRRLGLWNPELFPGGRSIRDFLERLARVPRSLAIHGNYFSNEDILFLADHPNVATVFCPRTHAFFEHSEHPVLRLLDAGARVVLGTDSRASNPDLSLWKELQFVATHYPEITLPQLLAMATTHAAEALGLPADRHTIRTGGPMQCVMLNVDNNPGDLRRMICHSATQPVAVFSNDSQKQTLLPV
jgi:cytosine/adenosine deaminase-related metal-dependent hydrolase